MQRTLRLCICSALLTVPATEAAQAPAKGGTAYPTKPIRIVVTYPPGGPTDIVARAVGQKLTEAWSQPVVIDNRAGAGGVVGTEVVARALPDGYTLLLGTSAGLAINPALNSKLPYNAFTDFAPISLIVINPQILVFNASFAPSSIKELIQLAKARPGQINYASVGPGSPNHLGMELLKSMAGIDMVHIPYKGTSPAVTDLLTGQVSLMFNSMPSVLPQVRAGKLKGIAVGSARRSQAAPDVPTVAEAGLPGFEYVTWYGLFAPVATPKEIVAKLNSEMVRMLGDRELAQRFASQGAEPASTTPAELAKFMRAEHERWKQVIKSGRIKVEG
jgi:tripartite-type tricarboxylate transporter receptor subunit TctC